MAYDYSTEFMDTNRELLDQLKGLAVEGSEATAEFARPQELRRWQTRVLNCLAVLNLYDEDFRKVRPFIRTWVNYSDGKWVLHVGIPKHRLRGGAPKESPLFQTPKGQPTPLRTTNNSKFFGDVTPENWREFQMEVVNMAMNPNIREFSAKFPSGFPMAALDTFDDFWLIDLNHEAKKATFTKRES